MAVDTKLPSGLTWGFSASALGLDESIDVTFHITALKSQPHFLIELGVGVSKGCDQASPQCQPGPQPCYSLATDSEPEELRRGPGSLLSSEAHSLTCLKMKKHRNVIC